MPQVLFIALLLSTALGPDVALGQFTHQSHTVTVEVTPVAGLTLSQGTLDLIIDLSNYTFGQAAMTTVDESTIIAWKINRRHQKVTVQTDRAAPRYVLKLQALNPTAGVAGPEIILQPAAQDLLRGIGKTSGYARLRYTASATAESGSGTEQHIVTFTVTRE